MIITDHAAEQYIKRIKKKIDIDKAKEEIEELFMELGQLTGYQMGLSGTY